MWLRIILVRLTAQSSPACEDVWLRLAMNGLLMIAILVNREYELSWMNE
jgi:hypothetical protein